jgi:hypothetical protein
MWKGDEGWVLSNFWESCLLDDGYWYIFLLDWLYPPFIRGYRVQNYGFGKKGLFEVF